MGLRENVFQIQCPVSAKMGAPPSMFLNLWSLEHLHQNHLKMQILGDGPYLIHVYGNQPENLHFKQISQMSLMHTEI